MNGTIICAVDENGGNEASVHVARRLADRFGARMLLVAVAEAANSGEGVEGLTATQARSGAKRRLERIVAQHNVPYAERRVAAGDPAETVAVIASEEAADLIVVGSSRGRFGRTLRSRLASELAATASCPVVVAPPEAVPAGAAGIRTD
jgi:nucleotide-binding universal stress UspA family protein